MQNSLTKIILALFILAILFGGGYFYWQYEAKTTRNSAPEVLPLSINKKALDELAKPQNYGQTISTDEPGFGRDNPFLPYK